MRKPSKTAVKDLFGAWNKYAKGPYIPWKKQREIGWTLAMREKYAKSLKDSSAHSTS